MVQYYATPSIEIIDCGKNICQVSLILMIKIHFFFFLTLVQITFISVVLFNKRLQGKAFQWPLSDNKTDSSASSSIQENEDSGRDSIDSRKIPQTKIPKVKFTCDGDSSASPSDSVSPADSVEYVNHPNCFFFQK